MNLVNLWHRIRSISSACLILMLNLIEFTEGSIKTRSFSLREMTRGLSKTSFEALAEGQRGKRFWSRYCTLFQPQVCCDARRPDEG